MLYGITKLACAVALVSGVGLGVADMDRSTEHRMTPTVSTASKAAMAQGEAILDQCRVAGQQADGTYRMQEGMFCIRYNTMLARLDAPAHPLSQCEACIAQCVRPNKSHDECMKPCAKACALF